MYNPHFNSPEFGGIMNAAGTNRFLLSVKQWVEKTNSRGIMAKTGRYGGTYAHRDIAFEFASWVSPKFKRGISAAIEYYEAIRELLAERGSKYRPMIAFSGEKEYGGRVVTEETINGFPSSEIEETFRSGDYRILVVADKFQTGYDEPLLHTMYVDKELSVAA